MKICDVTLREADQMTGRSYTIEQKIEAGKALDKLGVDIIEAGFPITGETDQQVIRELSETLTAKVSGLARFRIEDVDAALDANADLIQIFAPVDDDDLNNIVGCSRNQMHEHMRTAVDHSQNSGTPVNITLVNAMRADFDHVVEMFNIFSDVSNIGVADSVGCRTPAFAEQFFSDLGENGVDLSRVGAHFHDDLGVATANTLTAHAAGVGRSDVAVAALGERAGNTSLEQVVAAVNLEQDETFGLDVSELIPVCCEVLDSLNEPVDSRAPLLGGDVVRHEAGLHTAVMLDAPSTFEPFDPTRFGGDRELVFGTNTGRRGAQKLLERTNREPTDALVEKLLTKLAEEGPLGVDKALNLAQNIEV